MARLHPETSLAHLPLDAAVAPGRKSGVDPSLIGVFDESLRQARQPQSQPTNKSEISSPENRSSDEMHELPETAERQTRRTDEASPGEADAAPLANDAAVDNDAKPERGDGTDRTEGEETSRADESPDDAESDALVNPQAGAVDAGGRDAEAKPPGGEQVALEDQAGGPQTTDGVAAGAALGQEGEEAGIDELNGVSKATEEGIGEEPGPDSGQRGRDTAALAAAESDMAGMREEPTEDGEQRRAAHGAKSRAHPGRVEKPEDSAQQAAASHHDPADSGQSVPAASGPATVQLQNTPAAVEALAPLADTDQPGPNNTLPPAESANAATTADAKASSAQTQATAEQGNGKGMDQAVDPAKFVQRVAKAFFAMGQRGGPVRLKLYPPELGSLRMEITVKNGTLSARVEAETTSAKSILLDNLPLLRERLAVQGVKVDRFDVGVLDQSLGGTPERPDDGGRSFGHAKRRSNAPLQRNGHAKDDPEEQTTRGLTADGRLDVFI